MVPCVRKRAVDVGPPRQYNVQATQRKVRTRSLNRLHIDSEPDVFAGEHRLAGHDHGPPDHHHDAPDRRKTVVNGDNGFLVRVQDVDAPADAMEKLIEDPELRPRWAGEGGPSAVKIRRPQGQSDHF